MRRGWRDHAINHIYAAPIVRQNIKLSMNRVLRVIQSIEAQLSTHHLIGLRNEWNHHVCFCVLAAPTADGRIQRCRPD
jgi:hypothetical protein